MANMNVGGAGKAHGPQRPQGAGGAEKKTDVKAKKSFGEKKMTFNPGKGLKSLAKGIANKLGLRQKGGAKEFVQQEFKTNPGEGMSTEERLAKLSEGYDSKAQALMNQFNAKIDADKAAAEKKGVGAKGQDDAKAQEAAKAAKEAKAQDAAEAREVFQARLDEAKERMGLGEVDNTKAKRDMEMGEDLDVNDPGIPNPADVIYEKLPPTRQHSVDKFTPLKPDKDIEDKPSGNE